jgi:translation initiation factor 4A
LFETIFYDSQIDQNTRTHTHTIMATTLPFTPSEVEVLTSFDEMGLDDAILRGVYGYGFERPSAIQQRAVKPLLEGKDVIAQAQSGTGKTGTFTLGILGRIDSSLPHVQALVLAPTRELANQIGTVISAIGSYTGVGVHCCVGGTRVRDDIETLRHGISDPAAGFTARRRPVQVVVGTPGRVYDMMNRGALQTSRLRILVLDEADQMLDAGFKEQIRAIFTGEGMDPRTFTGMPKDMQVGLFSATITPDALEIAQSFMSADAVYIPIKTEEITLEGIKQYYVNVTKDEWKLDTLCDIYEAITITQAIIYCAKRRTVDWLTEQMRSRDFTVSATHGEMDATERETIMDEFRAGSSRVLITTDLMARGIDVQQVSLVINYDLPDDLANYIHRIGRSGRHGRKGAAINFVTDRDIHRLGEIQAYYSTHIDELPADLGSLSG